MDFAKKMITLYRNSDGRDKMRANTIISCTALLMFWMTYMATRATIGSSDSDSSSSLKGSDSNNYNIESSIALEGLGRLDYKEDIAAREKANIDFVEWDKCDAKFEG